MLEKREAHSSQNSVLEIKTRATIMPIIASNISAAVNQGIEGKKGLAPLAQSRWVSSEDIPFMALSITHLRQAVIKGESGLISARRWASTK